MNIASRFPVKSCPIMYWGIVALHWCFVFAIFYFFFISWLSLLAMMVVSISYYFCSAHYKKLTNAMDDLCWSGRHWLTHSDAQVKRLAHLTLQPNSWVSRHACLLHFTCEQQTYTWLFTRRNMGQRAYSELCYLAKQDLAAATNY